MKNIYLLFLLFISGCAAMSVSASASGAHKSEQCNFGLGVRVAPEYELESEAAVNSSTYVCSFVSSYDKDLRVWTIVDESERAEKCGVADECARQQVIGRLGLPSSAKTIAASIAGLQFQCAFVSGKESSTYLCFASFPGKLVGLEVEGAGPGISRQTLEEFLVSIETRRCGVESCN